MRESSKQNASVGSENGVMTDQSRRMLREKQLDSHSGITDFIRQANLGLSDEDRPRSIGDDPALLRKMVEAGMY